MSRARHGFKGSIVDEYTCCLRGSFFKRCFLVVYLFLLGTLWIFTIGAWFGLWIYDQVDRVTDIKFGFRDLRPTAVNSKVSSYQQPD